MSQTLTLYRMRYQVPLTEELYCSLEGAFEIQEDEFIRGSSCCQMIIDEENKIIYSLNEDTYLSEDFKYTLNGTYKVVGANYFHYSEDLENLPILETNFSREK